MGLNGMKSFLFFSEREIKIVAHGMCKELGDLGVAILEILPWNSWIFCED